LPTFLPPRGADGDNPAAGLTTELGQPEQLLDLRLCHQGLTRMMEEKVVDGAAHFFRFVLHPLDHLLWGRLWNIWSELFLKDISKSPY
jgi:hypothetical protein